jgi:hypothetical protein
MKKLFFQGPEDFSDMGECEKDLWVAGNMSRYQQWDCLPLVMEFYNGKLKQKGFFHSACTGTCKTKKYFNVTFLQI